MRLKLFLGALFLLASPLLVSAQTQVSLIVEGGTASGLGYKLPYIDFGIGLDKRLSRFELVSTNTYSPTAKAVTPDKLDSSLVMRTQVIFWATKSFGPTMTVSRTQLWTSQFNKGAWEFAPGVALAGHLSGTPMRLSIDYLLPSGGYDFKSGIEANRTQGPEALWESGFYKHLDFFFRVSVYRLLTQGDPLCDGSLGPVVATCRRGSTISGTATMGVRFVFPGGDL